MMMHQKVALRPPPKTVTKVAFTSASTAAQSLGGIKGVSITVKADQACYIIFGTSLVAAADSSSWPIFQYEKEEFYIPENSVFTHFRVIRATADGNLFWYVSNI